MRSQINLHILQREPPCKRILSYSSYLVLHSPFKVEIFRLHQSCEHLKSSFTFCFNSQHEMTLQLLLGHLWYFGFLCRFGSLWYFPVLVVHSRNLIESIIFWFRLHFCYAPLPTNENISSFVYHICCSSDICSVVTELCTWQRNLTSSEVQRVQYSSAAFTAQSTIDRLFVEAILGFPRY